MKVSVYCPACHSTFQVLSDVFSFRVHETVTMSCPICGAAWEQRRPPQITLKQKDPLDQLEKEEAKHLRESFPRYYQECLDAGLTPEQIHAIINLIKSITA